MTLKRRLILHITVLTAGVLLLGVAAVLGVSSLHQDFSLALRANEQLRQTYTIGQHVAAARSQLAQSSPARAAAELQRAQAQYEIAAQTPWLPTTEPQADAVRAALDAAQAALAHNPDPSTLDSTYAALADLSAATRRAIESRQTAANRKHDLTLYTVAALAGLLTLAAVVAAARLYRSVMTPLGTLQRATRQLGPSDLTARAPTDADPEFASVAADFNRMAAELQSLYADLEQRVETKSRQLARSERLASVGYLAAGVAHEINNPLAVIAGFAERSAQRLARPPLADDATLDPVRRSLQAISEEAFRCKQITTRLLELARPSGPSARTTFPLATLAAEVLASVGGLPRLGTRHLSIDAPADDTTVHANEGELRQVILNLLINAIEATDPDTGRLTLRVSRDGPTVELSVTDDGRGIDPASLPHLFEPFFSDKRVADRPGGTGLGLSIAHSIVTDHAGTLDAHSAGPGRGATVTLRLPAAHTPEPAHA